MNKENKPVYVLRTCNADLTSYEGFKWPESGYVEAPDWDPSPVCGYGLHGLLWGAGDGELLDWRTEAKWLIVRVEGSVVYLGQKVKFKSGYVEFCGDHKSATDFIISKGADPANTVGATVAVGDDQTATAGNRGTATAGWEGTATAGNRGTATAGNRGTATAGDYGTATAGWEGTATAGDYGTATAGDYGTATAGNRGTATAGKEGTATAGDYGTATAGNRGTATAGEVGMISIKYWDDEAGRYRIKTGYIGEDGLKPDTLYRLNNDNEFVPA